MTNLRKKLDLLTDAKKERVLQMIYRQSLSAFTQKSFKILNPGSPYYHNWHIDLISDHLERCARGETTRLIITIPPRYGKSMSASVAFNAWLLGHNPHAKIVGISYGSHLAEEHSQNCKKLMTSSFYRKLFPGTRLSKKENKKDFYKTGHGGFRMATSVDGALTGMGGDFLIIDDPIKPQDALSDISRDHVNNWFKNTVSTRLNDKKNGCIILVMQRVHDDDLVGHLLEQEDWVHLNLPAIAEEDEEHIIHPFTGEKVVFKRAEGEALHPEREPIEKLNYLRQTQLGSSNFAAQYQQRPVQQGGDILKLEWFKRYGEIPTEGRLIGTVQSWDTASKTGAQNDYSVCTTWRVYKDRYYLVDVYRKKLAFTELEKKIREMQEFHKANVVLIEDANAASALIDTLKRKPMCANVEGCYSSLSKGDRAMSISMIIETGKVFIPRDAHWLEEFEREVTHFPKGKHDDQVDSMVQALNYIHGKYAAHYSGKLFSDAQMEIVRAAIAARHEDRW